MSNMSNIMTEQKLRNQVNEIFNMNDVSMKEQLINTTWNDIKTFTRSIDKEEQLNTWSHGNGFRFVEEHYLETDYNNENEFKKNFILGLARNL